MTNPKLYVSTLCLALSTVAIISFAGPPATAPIASGAGQAPDSLDILKDRPDAPNNDLLGPPFESQAAGIALSPPAGCKQVKRAGVPDELVAYVNEQKDWIFKVLRLTFSQPVPLTNRKDAAGAEQQGVMDITLQQLQRSIPAAEVVRQDTTNVGEADVGMLALRYQIGTTYRLTQQAIIAANDQVYYVLDLTTPGSRPRGGGEGGSANVADRSPATEPLLAGAMTR
jgi:hypothetical protein